MATYAYLIKAKAKAAEAKNLFCWFEAKSDSRAEREILNILDDADIEVGRGADYQLPVRTNWFVVDDLPAEGVLDDTWCDRYELADDQRTWKVIPGAAEQEENSLAPASTATIDADLPAAPVTATDTADAGNTSLLENRTPAVRFAVHLLGDKYLSEISQEQQIVANELVMDDNNSYLHNLLQARIDVPDMSELSLHAEWKLVQAVKEVFSLDKEHESSLLAAFMSDWIKADDRNQLVEDWKSGKLPAKPEAPKSLYEHGLKISEHDDGGPHYPVCKMSFRKQLLSQLTADELRHHITRAEHAEIAALEMDTDNSYVQNLLLAAENCEEIKGYDTKDLWRYTKAIRQVFSQDKRHELALVLRFTRIWAATDYIDRGILVKEWVKSKRISHVQRTDTGTNAGGGIATDRNQDYVHTLDTLDVEIALATLPMDFNIYDIPGGVHRRAKEIVQKNESPFKEWSAALRKTPGILDYSRAVIFALIRSAHPECHQYPGRLTGYINAYLTESNHEAPPEETLAAARHAPEASWENEAADQKASAEQPQIANMGNGVFSIDGLMNEKQPETDDRSPINVETTSDVQMEATVSIEKQNDPQISANQATDADDVEPDPSADTVTDEAAVSTSKLFTHLMVDLETVGSNPDAPIVSIGAVFFEPSTGETGPEFYQVVDLASAMRFGAQPDASTILWWMKQSSEARSALLVEDAADLDVALTLFSEFLCENAANGTKSVQVWGNGATFDNVLLKQSYGLVGGAAPWRFVNDRDVRTIVELGNAVGINPRYDIPFEGDKHNALADARHQAKYVSAIWQRLTAN
ncbi:3'-5' exoribonuclease domain-containing protein [Atlantibacter sp.]|uniref:exonuclease n=1 Tax=Atlantibacter sp. TaxID=1903473 RepID=UPI0028AB3EF3|nr:3'-5' exoribonuclease [Atlantibacter sp.]